MSLNKGCLGGESQNGATVEGSQVQVVECFEVDGRVRLTLWDGENEITGVPYIPTGKRVSSNDLKWSTVRLVKIARFGKKFTIQDLRLTVTAKKNKKAKISLDGSKPVASGSGVKPNNDTRTIKLSNARAGAYTSKIKLTVVASPPSFLAKGVCQTKRLILADETGTVNAIAWKDCVTKLDLDSLKPGMCIELENLTFSSITAVQQYASTVSVQLKLNEKFSKMTILDDWEPNLPKYQNLSAVMRRNERTFTFNTLAIVEEVGEKDFGTNGRRVLLRDSSTNESLEIQFDGKQAVAIDKDHEQRTCIFVNFIKKDGVFCTASGSSRFWVTSQGPAIELSQWAFDNGFLSTPSRPTFNPKLLQPKTAADIKEESVEKDGDEKEEEEQEEEEDAEEEEEREEEKDDEGEEEISDSEQQEESEDSASEEETKQNQDCDETDNNDDDEETCEGEDDSVSATSEGDEIESASNKDDKEDDRNEVEDSEAESDQVEAEQKDELDVDSLDNDVQLNEIEVVEISDDALSGISEFSDSVYSLNPYHPKNLESRKRKRESVEC